MGNNKPGAIIKTLDESQAFNTLFHPYTGVSRTVRKRLSAQYDCNHRRDNHYLHIHYESTSLSPPGAHVNAEVLRADLGALQAGAHCHPSVHSFSAVA